VAGCCPCTASGSCSCQGNCIGPCGTCNQTRFWDLTLSGFTGAGCTVLNNTWKLCTTSTSCQWLGGTASVVIQLDFIQGVPNGTWQLKISADGINFTYFTIAEASFFCDTNNTLNFDHSDAGFTCGGVPSTVTLNNGGVCCDAGFCTCCCSSYPQDMIATITKISGGCGALDGVTITLTSDRSGCNNCNSFSGTSSVTIGGIVYCVSIQILCQGNQGACGFVLPSGASFEVCDSGGGSCAAAGQQACTANTSAPFYCDQLDAANQQLPCDPNDVTCTSNTNCKCSPFLLVFNNVVLDTTITPGGCSADPLCNGTYRITITG